MDAEEQGRGGETTGLLVRKEPGETKLQPFVKVANTLMASRTGILAWYDAPVTNAILEGINNKIKVMKRRAYGYRDDEYFKLLLLGLHDKTNAIRG